MSKELQAEISQWDGRSKAEIDAVFHRWRDRPDFVAQLVKGLLDPAQTIAATWLIKRGIEAKVIAARDVEDAVIRSIEGLEHTDAKLHVLQILPALQIPQGQAQNVERFVRECLASPNKFLSTWAYSGFHALATRFPEYRQEVTEILETGMRDGPPATKARIRNLMKQGFPGQSAP